MTDGTSWVRNIYVGMGRRVAQITATGSSVLQRDTAVFVLGGVRATLHEVGHFATTEVPFTEGTSSQTGVKYFLKDHLGTPRVVVQNGQAIEYSTYFPFGLQNPALSQDNVGEENVRGFTGGEAVAQQLGINLQLHGVRWYDTAIGRWNATDMRAEGMFNISSYSYAFNNPGNRTDVSGLFPEEEVGGNRAVTEELYARGMAVFGGPQLIYDEFGRQTGYVLNGRHYSNTTNGPVRGGDGAGVNGVYYDHFTGAYRSTVTGDEVSISTGQRLASSVATHSYRGAAAEAFLRLGSVDINSLPDQYFYQGRFLGISKFGNGFTYQVKKDHIENFYTGASTEDGVMYISSFEASPYVTQSISPSTLGHLLGGLGAIATTYEMYSNRANTNIINYVRGVTKTPLGQWIHGKSGSTLKLLEEAAFHKTMARAAKVVGRGFVGTPIPRLVERR